MSHPHGKLDGIRKIAVLRANALGDYVFSTAALYALRAAYPDAEIVLLGKNWHADFLDGRPGPVDRVIPVPPYKGVSMPDTWTGLNAEIQAHQDIFFQQVQAENFDLALQMHGGGGNSNPFVKRLRARITAGMRAPGAPPLDRWMPYVYWQHEVLRQIEVVRLVGAEMVMLEPKIEVTERDLRESCHVEPETGKGMVVLHPGASDPRRRWPAERFAAVGDALVAAGYEVIVVGISSENEVVQQVVKQMRERVIDLCGALSLHGLTGLIARASLVVTNDSGPRHLAEAVGTPTVSIFWCGNLINAGSAFRTYHRPHLSWRITCPVCGKNTLHEPCSHAVSFVDEVQTGEVIESSLDVLRFPKENQYSGAG